MKSFDSASFVQIAVNGHDGKAEMEADSRSQQDSAAQYGVISLCRQPWRDME